MNEPSPRKSDFAERLAAAAVGHPFRVLAGLLLAIVLAAPALPSLRVDASVERLRRRDAPGWQALRATSEAFGSDDVVVIAQIADGPAVTAERLAQLRELGEAIEAVDGVASVWSLAATGHVRGSPAGLDILDLVADLPEDPAERAALERSVETSPLHRRHLLSEDGRTAAVVVFPEDRPDDPLLRERVASGVRAAMAAAQRPGLRLVATGNPTFTVDVAETLARDQTRFTGLSLLVLAVALGFFFRSGVAVALSLAAVAIACVLTLGAVSALGRDLSALLTVVPSLLLAVGVTYAIHVLHRYREAAGPAERRARSAFAGVAPATLLSVVTTMAGFAALGANRIDAIREFGWVAAGAIAVGAGVVLALLPVSLARLGTRLAPADPGDRLGRALDALEALSLRREHPRPAASFALALTAVWGVARLETDTAYVDYLQPDHPANLDRLTVLEHLAGPIPLRVRFDAGAPDGALQPDLLARVAAFQRHVETLPHVQASYSLVDLLADMNRAWHADAPDPETHREPPGSAELAAQYLLLYESSRFAGDLERLIGFDRDRLVVWIRTDLYRSKDASETLAALEAHLASGFDDLAPKVSGTLAMLFRSSDEISRGQARSLLLALLAIGTVVMAVFRSARLGLAAAVPNLLPVLLMFGAMGAFGVPLNVGTCVVACLCLGVAADDTIHFVLAWRDAALRGGDSRAAVREAFARVGRPILQTSLALTAGFSVLAFSGFQPIAHLGWLSALTMAACVIGDLLVLPALLARIPAPTR